VLTPEERSALMEMGCRYVEQARSMTELVLLVPEINRLKEMTDLPESAWRTVRAAYGKRSRELSASEQKEGV
jgi:hypothetical protein